MTRELLEYQYHHLKNALNEVTLPFSPLPHRKLIELTCLSWVRENPHVEPSNARIEVEVIPFADLIRPFGVDHAKQFFALAQRICDALDRYSITEPVGDRIEQIALLKSLCQECQKVITDCKASGSKKEYVALKKPFTLHELTQIVGRYDANALSNYLYHFVEVLANGREIVSIKGSGSIISLEQLVKQQILSIHADDLLFIQAQLNAIATDNEYKDLIAEYDTMKWAHRRYQELLANAYPAFFRTGY